jgi:hypothetical protein
MASSVHKFGALIWRVTNGGGHMGKVFLQKTKQTNKWLFFAQKL